MNSNKFTFAIILILIICIILNCLIPISSILMLGFYYVIRAIEQLHLQGNVKITLDEREDD